MYKDIITYELADGITEEHLKKVAIQILEEWMEKLPGFVSWELNKSGDDKYVDIVCWESKEAAMSANREMANIPNAGEWYACYKKESISAQNITTVAAFNSKKQSV